MGNLSLNLSHWILPRSERFQRLKSQVVPTIRPITMYHCLVTRCDRKTVNLVIAGSSPPKSLKTFSKTGTRKATSAISTMPAKPPITDG